MLHSGHETFEFEPNENLFTLFERHALQAPDAVAVIDADGPASYGAVLERAAAICSFLHAQDLAPEQPVGVLMERRAELPAVLLGIMKAGGAYVPIDPDDPPDRVIKTLAACGCSLLLGDPVLMDALPKNEKPGNDTSFVMPTCISLETIASPSKDTGLTTTAPGGNRLAYLLNTSGSTGEPKAVEVEHRNVLTLLRSACELLKFGPSDRYLASSTIAFDASITELFLPLVTGASLVMRDRNILLDPRQLANDIREFGISIVQTGPSVWSVILAEIDNFPRVRIAITHGEAVDPVLARRLCNYGDEVWNLYGPTETTVWAIGHCLSSDTAESLSPVSAPIGKPLPHINAFVANDQGDHVEDGVEGELCLGGASITRGYRNNDTLTRERFGRIEGERVYRTGDVVLQDKNGVLHYFGRNDDQMQIRGVRIEPGEVEAAILKDTRVAQAAVTWFPTPSGTRAIVAAIVPRPGQTFEARDLHEDLETRLPRPMIPARFMFVPWLPMTTSGKVDRKALREAATSTPKDKTMGNPATPERQLSNTEKALSGIWQRMLEVESVAPDDHFFSIGGDSLTAVQMMIEVETLFGMQLPVHLAFEAPTLASLASRIDAAIDRADEEIDRGFVFPLAGSGEKTPIFFCHLDLTLARHGLWTVPCPVYAVVYWARGSGFIEARSIEALAAEHLSKVREIQPHGPYRIAGYSLGGLIALEMAQQLKAAGEEVEMLFLLDPMAPWHWSVPGIEAPPANYEPLRVRALRRAKRIAQGPGDIGWSRWLAALIPLPLSMRHRSPLAWIHYKLVNQHLRRPSKVSQLLFPKDRWPAFWFSARKLVRHYVAHPYKGRALVVFCNNNTSSRQAYETLLDPDTDMQMIEATHLNLFQDPALNRWMEWLSQAVR